MTRYRRDLDNQGCCNAWQHGIRTIDGQYPDDNRDFNLQAGDGIEITPVTAGVEISVKAPLPGPMVFRGTVGTGGTIATLPDANVDNIGWAYVAVSAGTTPDDTPKNYAIGDMLVSDGAEWVVIPAGDDPVAWSQITGKPTTLSGYGITDAVTLNTAQTITNVKTFTSSATKIKLMNDSAYTSGDQYSPYIDFASDNSGAVIGRLFTIRNGTTGAFNIDIRAPADGSWKGTASVRTDGTSVWMQTPTRTYNSANTYDIVTIGSLASNPNVVHTTGNETIGGTKSFDNPMIPYNGSTSGLLIDRNGDVTSGVAQNLIFQTIRDKNGEVLLNLWARINTTGKVDLYSTLRNADGTQRTTLIA